jgi:hypothetical protein
MRTRIRIGVVGAVVVAAVFIAGYALAASAPSAFKPVGVTRYAMVSRTAAQSGSTTSIVMVDMPGLAATITVPPGKAADVIVTFSGVVQTCNTMYVQALVGGTAASPGEVRVAIRPMANSEARAFTFYGTVGPGNHTIRIQWRGNSDCVAQFVYARTMVVTANVR